MYYSKTRQHASPVIFIDSLTEPLAYIQPFSEEALPAADSLDLCSSRLCQQREMLQHLAAGLHLFEQKTHVLQVTLNKH